MQFTYIIASLLSTAVFVTQVAALPIEARAAEVGLDFHDNTPRSLSPFEDKSYAFELERRANKDPTKHEANAANAKANAEAHEDKEQEAKKKAAKAQQNGDTNAAHRANAQAENQEKKEQTANHHAEIAGKKADDAKKASGKKHN